MARHIMAVCVVCLLCADRLPCQQHTESDKAFGGVQALVYPNTQPQSLHKLNAPVYRPSDLAPTTLDAAMTPVGEKRTHTLQRRKRHQHNDAEEQQLSSPELTQTFLQQIFDDYGQGGDTLSTVDFQRMLRQMGLLQLLKTPQQRNNNNNINNTCIADELLVRYLKPQHTHLHEGHDDAGVAQNSSKCALALNAVDANAPCANGRWSEKALRELENETHLVYTLNKADFLNVCPVLLYQLASPLEVKRAGCIDSALLSDIDRLEQHQLEEKQENIAYVWIYAFISVFACSILGLVGVAIIPFMGSRYYKHIIQFFVSLAVGTMTGDAVLHLLPHSLAGQSERNMIFKGLTCMGGIIFFYMTEHGLTMISEWRKRIAKTGPKQKPSRGVKVVREPDSSISSQAGDKLCKSKYSSYPYCYDEIALDSKADVWVHQPNKIATATVDFSNSKRNGKADGEDSNAETAAQSLLSTSQNNYAPMVDNYHRQQQGQQTNHKQASQQLPDAIAVDLDSSTAAQGVIMPDGGATINGNIHPVPNNGSESNDNSSKGSAVQPPHISDTVMVILREHESSHHGHSHKHGHVHSPPESLSAVAWMIIMGDGLHNFTDGMAIGAAFADNIAGGFSTSLAVFCHELPHELGDFAILIKAGMTVKSAVYYNLFTGLLSFVGMIFGIAFGQSQDTAQWMFAAAAGLFIYIALVDMMPELSSAHKTIPQFVLQILGMMSGVLIMLCIAIYEEDLMNVFATTATEH